MSWSLKTVAPESAGSIVPGELGIEQLMSGFERATKTLLLPDHYLVDEILSLAELGVPIAHHLDGRLHEEGNTRPSLRTARHGARPAARSVEARTRGRRWRESPRRR